MFANWWGGWSEGEKARMIMRCLLDEFSRYDAGYSDMLAPDRDDSRRTTFMGGGGSNADTVASSRLRDIETQSLKRSMEKSF